RLDEPRRSRRRRGAPRQDAPVLSRSPMADDLPACESSTTSVGASASERSGSPIRFPPELPISARVSDIATAIDQHQVVIVAGATGSGKTTQLPKIALAMGRGLEQIIGVTQPRRIAATSVAAR